MKSIFIIIYVLLYDVKGSRNIEINVTSPAILDVPAWFSARLSYTSLEHSYEFHWTDSSYFNVVHKTTEPFDIFNFTYDSDIIEPGERTVELTISGCYFVLCDAVAHKKVHFEVTNSIPLQIVVQQFNSTIPYPTVISSANQTNLTAVVHDPHNWMKSNSVSAQFFWIVNNNFGNPQCPGPSLLINITEGGQYDIQVYVNIDFGIPILLSTNSDASNADLVKVSDSNTLMLKEKLVPGRQWRCSGTWLPHGYSNVSVAKRRIMFGYAKLSLEVRAPIVSISINGSTWIKHWDVLNLNIKCSGTGPFSYCKLFKEGSYNVTGKEDCEGTAIVTTVCDFYINRYFKKNGTKTVVIILSNVISHTVHSVAINVYNDDHKQQLTYVIVPVVCSLVVVSFIIFGLAYIIQSRQQYFVEVADFDFTAGEEEDLLSFWQQLKASAREAVSRRRKESVNNPRWRMPNVEDCSILDD